MAAELSPSRLWALGLLTVQCRPTALDLAPQIIASITPHLDPAK